MKYKFVLLLFALTAIVVPMSAAPTTFVGFLNGPNEEPPVPSPATGSTRVTIDPVAHTLQVEVDYSGLLGNTTASHIHVINGPGDLNTADTLGPVATTTPTFPGFPSGPGSTFGTYDQTFDTLSAGTYRAGFLNDSAALHPALLNVEAAELELFSAIISGRAYLNVHSTVYPGGEIRDFLQAVPEPASVGLAAASIAVLALLRRRQRSRA